MKGPALLALHGPSFGLCVPASPLGFAGEEYRRSAVRTLGLSLRDRRLCVGISGFTPSWELTSLALSRDCQRILAYSGVV